MYLLTTRQQCLHAPQVNGDSPLTHVLNSAVNDLSFTLSVGIVQHIPLCLSDALQDDLLGGLRGDAPKVIGGSL